MLLCRACAEIDARISGAVPALAAGTLTSVHTLPSGLRDVLRNAGRRLRDAALSNGRTELFWRMGRMGHTGVPLESSERNPKTLNQKP